MTGCYQTGSPVTGLRKSLPRPSSPTPCFLKSNMLFRLPEIESKLPEMAGSPQLPSMNLVIEAWLVSVWSTKLDFAQGEMTSSGSRGPRPQRPLLARQRGAGAARAGPGEGVASRVGRVGHTGVRVVVPAVGVVIGDDDRGVLPVRGLLQRVDLVGDPVLLVERVGVGGVPVRPARRLEERHRGQCRRRQFALADRGDQLVEVARVVLVVRRVELRHAADVGLGVGADRLQPGERVLTGCAGRDGQVVRVGGRGVVLERLVVRDVVVLVPVLTGPGAERRRQLSADRGGPCCRCPGWMACVRPRSGESHRGS